MQGMVSQDGIIQGLQEVSDCLAVLQEMCALSSELHLSMDGSRAISGMIARSQGQVERILLIFEKGP
jgi:hypothetical protein